MNEAFLLEQLSFYLAHLDNNYIAVNNWHGEAAVRLMEKFIETGLSLGDEQSAETYEMVFAAWLGTFFLDLHHYISLRPFYSHEQWMEFFNEAEKHKVNGDDLLERVECWGLENYSYHGDAYDCEVEKGDIVIDLGAFTGNTPIYFAQKTGVTGHVYAFEATPKTVEILRENLALKHVANVSVIPLAVSDKEEILYFPVTSSGTNKAVASGVKVSAVPLDLWVEQNEIKQIDFIKMDIEGAEMSAIEGAKNTIKRFSPKLAISVYHNPEHFFTVPKKVLSINPNYKLFVNHGSRDLSETCMFFLPAKEACQFPVVPNLDQIKNLYFSAYQALRTKVHTAFFDKVICYTNIKHNLIDMPVEFFFLYNESFIKIPFSRIEGAFYKITIRDRRIDIELHFENIKETLTATEQEKIASFYKTVKAKYPFIMTWESYIELNLYFYLRQTKDTELLKYDIHRYKDISEQVSDYLALLIQETLPFLIENGFVSGEHLFFWRNIKVAPVVK